ncbi:MAG: phosphate signaling complex protein PhoU [Candidatus Riflebacteria bacterium]|nr:phosphate signaling complex protein PhoU [Candidatus Riflebacteria bacterium]
MLIKRQMDDDLKDLSNLLDDMEKGCLSMLEKWLDAVLEGKENLISEIFDMEVEVNRCQMKVDDLVWKIMALYQPAASELRILIGAIKIAEDLERVGDEVCAMCRRTVELANIAQLEFPGVFIEMRTMVKTLFKDSIFAVKKLDPEMAESIFIADNAIDDAFQTLFEWARNSLENKIGNTDNILAVLSMGRSLERIADHATNLAEITIFMKKGQDVRHHCLKF